MKPSISEFQFGYGVNRELEMGEWRYPLVTPPRIPTQSIEAHIGYDMDAQISNGTGAEPLFLQYKRSEHMIGSNARYWNRFPKEYYRFKITNATQHNTLVKTADYYPHTYYVAPIFSTNKEYLDHYPDNEVVENSLFAVCKGLPVMDDNDDSDRHTIGFTRNRTLFFSEPTEIESFIGISDILADIAESEETLAEIEQLKQTFSELNENIANMLDYEIEMPNRNSPPLEWIREQQEFFMCAGINLSFALDINEKRLIELAKWWVKP